MGIETALFAAASIASARATTSAAKSEAKAVVKQGTLAAKNKATETIVGAAKIRSSFLNSGLTLEGTPSAVIRGAYTTGMDDVTQIAENANTKSKNIMGAARTKAITSLISSAAGAWGGSSLGFGDALQSGVSSVASYLPESTLGSLNEFGFGETAFSAFMKKDARADAGDWVGL
jgi:hypothetical protein